jgi:deoxycytidylate deaminase
MTISTFDFAMLRLARDAAEASPDPVVKTGAVIVDAGGQVLSSGCSRLPTGLCPEVHAAWLADPETRAKTVIHADRVAILSAHGDLRGATLYTWPVMSF